MSLSFLTKPIGGAKKQKGTEPAAPAPESPRAKAGPIRGGAGNVGGSPRVDLMPPEIRTKRSQLRLRRNLRFALLGVLAVVLVACGGTWALATAAQTTLAQAQAQQQLMLAQQAKYSDVTKVKDSIALIKAGQVVGDSSEIDWQRYLTDLQRTLPAGVTLSTVTIQSISPIKSFAQSATPLEGSRIATLQFTATSGSLPSIPAWLDGLKSLPGFVDATPGSVSLSATGGYTADVVMHINSEALANRFAPEKADSATSTGSDSASTNGGN